MDKTKSLDLQFTPKEKASSVCSLNLSQLSLFWQVTIYLGTGGGGQNTGGSQKHIGYPQMINMAICISTEME